MVYLSHLTFQLMPMMITLFWQHCLGVVSLTIGEAAGTVSIATQIIRTSPYASMYLCYYLIFWTTHLPMLHLMTLTSRCLSLVYHFWVTVSSIIEVTVKTIAHHRPELRYRWQKFIPRKSLKFQVSAAPSLCRRFIARKNMIMSLVYMGSGGGQG